MLEFRQRGMITLERIVEKMCHAPAICFQIDRRGFLDEGYWADVVILDPEREWEVNRSNLYYKCGWSPLVGHTFKGKVTHTIVSGHLAYQDGVFDERVKGKRLAFDR